MERKMSHALSYTKFIKAGSQILRKWYSTVKDMRA